MASTPLSSRDMSGDPDLPCVLTNMEFGSWAEFFAFVRSIVVAVGRRTGLRETEIDDLVQDVFLVVYLYLIEGRYSNEGATCLDMRRRCAAFIRMIATRTARKRCAQRDASRSRVDVEGVECQDPSVGSLQAMVNAESSRRIKHALDGFKARMPADAAAIYELRHVQGWPVYVIAAIMQENPKTIASRLSRLRDDLREHMENALPDLFEKSSEHKAS